MLALYLYIYQALSQTLPPLALYGARGRGGFTPRGGGGGFRGGRGRGFGGGRGGGRGRGFRGGGRS